MPLTYDDFKKLANGSDIRGVAIPGVPDEPVTLTPEAANRIAAGFVRFLSETTGKSPAELQIAVGHDSRISALAIKDSVLTGLTHTGAHGIDCVLASTPAMFMATIFEDTAADGSIMITASHLPYNRNGLKFFTAAGGADKADIQKILAYAAEAKEAHGTLDHVLKFDLIGRYCEHLRKKIRDALGGAERPLAGMHIVVDAGNGAGGFFAGRILTPLGADTSGSRYLNPDGHFPNHIPNPENADAMRAIKDAVVKNHADLGLIFDTDVDRMSAVLADGTDVSRNALIAMMAAILAPDYPGSTIITDSVTSDGLHDFLEDHLHLKHLRYMRGYKNVINESLRLNENGEESWLAIETSGHAALRENYFLDDGAYLVAKLIVEAACLRKEGKELQDLIADLQQPVESKEIRFKIDTDDFKTYGEQVLEHIKAAAEKEHDWQLVSPNYEGVRIACTSEKEQGWFLLRQSLHDPVLPLNIESNVEGGVNRITDRVLALLTNFKALKQ
mgnify:CR=1 FL=1